MKENYKEMEMEIIRFSSEDVIVTSCGTDPTGDNQCPNDNLGPDV